MCGLGERLGLSRVCVHADGWAATATLGEPWIELKALLTGCLLASARAEAGTLVIPRRAPSSAIYRAPPFEEPIRRGKWWLVSCAAPYLAAPVTTLGLGDTFMAGCLLVLGAERQVSLGKNN